MAVITTGATPKALQGGNMAGLSTAARTALPTSDFALPDKRKYPVDTSGRARNALSRVSQFGTPMEKERVRAKVASAWPAVQQSHNDGGTAFHDATDAAWR
jgi:hypothetical protein